MLLEAIPSPAEAMYRPEGEKRATLTGAVCRFSSDRKSTSTGILVLEEADKSLEAACLALWTILHIYEVQLKYWIIVSDVILMAE
jgi:hypothetical protein